MGTRSIRLKVLDILECIADIEETLNGLDFAAYGKRRTTRRTVERCIEIISEASRHIPTEIQLRHPTIPWQNIRGVGNVLRHDYQHVADPIMWQTATVSVPELKTEMETILTELPPDTDP